MKLLTQLCNLDKSARSSFISLTILFLLFFLYGFFLHLSQSHTRIMQQNWQVVRINILFLSNYSRFAFSECLLKSENRHSRNELARFFAILVVSRLTNLKRNISLNDEMRHVILRTDFNRASQFYNRSFNACLFTFIGIKVVF